MFKFQFTFNSLAILALSLCLTVPGIAATASSGPDSDGDGVPDSVDNCTYAPNPNQLDTNNNGYGNLCDGDLNFDHFVNALDLGLFKQAYSSSPGANPHAIYDPDSDFNGDGLVNNTDKALFAGFFGKPPGPGATRSVNIIVNSGHGLLFDASQAVLNFDQSALNDMQNEMLGLFNGAYAGCINTGAIQSTLTQVNAAISTAAASGNKTDQLFLQGAELNLLLGNAQLSGNCPSSFKPAYYSQQNMSILYQAMAKYGTPQDSSTQNLMIACGLLPQAPAPKPLTYEQTCKNAGVPIPPSLDATQIVPNGKLPAGSNWTSQGNLTVALPLIQTNVTNNLLDPKDFAQILTYVTPNANNPNAPQGACIALPRWKKSGAFVLSGIICQGYATGNACFWDSTVRPTAGNIAAGLAGGPIDFTKQVLYPVQDPNNAANVPNMNDGFTFVFKNAAGLPQTADGAVCTGCHTGSNVFNILPDDTVWSKVIINSGNTYQIDQAANPKIPNDPATGFNLYIPVVDPAFGWTNNPIPTAVAGCDTCHEYPNANLLGFFNRLEANNAPNNLAQFIANPLQYLNLLADFLTYPPVVMGPDCGGNCY